MFKVAALYKFSSIDNPFQVQNYLKQALKKLSIYGTILVGNEGINGTIAAALADADAIPLLVALARNPEMDYAKNNAAGLMKRIRKVMSPTSTTLSV